MRIHYLWEGILLYACQYCDGGHCFYNKMLVHRYSINNASIKLVYPNFDIFSHQTQVPWANENNASDTPQIVRFPIHMRRTTETWENTANHLRFFSLPPLWTIKGFASCRLDQSAAPPLASELIPCHRQFGSVEAWRYTELENPRLLNLRGQVRHILDLERTLHGGSRERHISLIWWELCTEEATSGGGINGG